MAYSTVKRFLGINKRTEAKLKKRGIFTIGDLAQYPYRYLKERFWYFRRRYAFTC